MINTIIGNYKILKELGTGGMGTVYLAEHTKIGSKVAIKALHQHLFKNESIKVRFLKEAKTQAILEHSSITKVIDFIDNKKGLFIILEYIEGYELNEYLFHNKGLMPEKEANMYMAKILDAVSYAHSKGIVHRDLKSANIMITPDAGIKIMDFGIAKIAGDSMSLTKTGSRLGSPLYMSPEQVTGSVVDFRSDIYSLGVVYHEMLTGKPVYDQTNTTEYEIYDKIVRHPLPRLKTFYKLISEHAQEVVDRATSKLPAARYQSCEEFKHSLKANSTSQEKGFYSGKKPKHENNNNFAKVFGIIAMIIVVGFVIMYAFQNNLLDFKPDYSENIKNAEELLNQNKYKEALVEYEGITDIDNNNTLAKNKIQEIEELSESYENEQVEYILKQAFAKISLKDIDENDSIFKRDFINNFRNVKNELETLKNNDKIVGRTDRIDNELKNIETLSIYYLALNLIAENKHQEALDLLKNSQKIGQNPLIDKLTNELTQTLNIKTNLEGSIFPFELVDIVPKFPGCNKKDNEAQTNCFKTKINNYILANINLKSYNTLGLKNGLSIIYYNFQINEQGKIVDIKVSADHSRIVNEVTNILASIKNVVPGRIRNQVVAVNFNDTLSVNIGKSEKKKEIEIEEDEQVTQRPIPSNLTIQMVDRAPIFPGCEGKIGVSLMKCTSSKINSFISTNVNQNNLKGNNIPVGVTTSIIDFRITEQGRVTNVTVLNPNEIVKNEIKRVVNSLPYMSPALYENTTVPISYRLTLTTTIKMEK